MCVQHALFGLLCQIISGFSGAEAGISVPTSDHISTQSLLLSFDIYPTLGLQDALIARLGTAPGSDFVDVSLIAGRILLRFALGAGTALDLGVLVVVVVG